MFEADLQVGAYVPKDKERRIFTAVMLTRRGDSITNKFHKLTVEPGTAKCVTVKTLYPGLGAPSYPARRLPGIYEGEPNDLNEAGRGFRVEAPVDYSPAKPQCWPSDSVDQAVAHQIGFTSRSPKSC